MEEPTDANRGLATLLKIRNVLNEEDAHLPGEEVSPHENLGFKFAPLTSCDVDWSFSRYKAMLTEDRSSFKFENLKMSFIVACFHKSE